MAEALKVKEFDPVAVRREALALGKEMGLENKDLTKWVKEAAESAEVAHRHAQNAAELANKQEMKRMELEQKKIEKDAEIAKKQLEAETERRKLDHDHEQKMAKLNAKKKDEPDDHGTAASNTGMFGGMKNSFKLPRFDEEN